jgi:hypothetical protein
MAGIGRIVTPPSDAAPGCTSHVSTPMVRFHHGKARINSRLGPVGGLDADGWGLPTAAKMVTDVQSHDIFRFRGSRR